MNVRISQWHYLWYVAICIQALVCFSVTRALSQEYSIPFERIEVPNNSSEIFAATDDDDGFIWFGRLDGIYRFNGNDFTRYASNPADSTSITHGRPLCLSRGRNSDLWIGTNTGGVSRLDLNRYKFETFRHHTSDTNSLGGNYIGSILDDGKGSVWVGSDDFCLNKLNLKGHTITRFYPETMGEDRRFSNFLGKIVSDQLNPDILWIGAPFGVYRFNKTTGKFKLYRFPAYDNVYKPYPVAVYVDEDGIVWASSTDGIVRIDPFSNELRAISIPKRVYPSSVVGWTVSDIQKYSNSEFVIVTHHDGLIAYNRETGITREIKGGENTFSGANFYLAQSSGTVWSSSGAFLLRAHPRMSLAKSINLKAIPGANWSRAFLPVSGKNTLYVGTLAGSGLLYVDFDTREVTPYPYQYDPKLERDVFMRDLAYYSDSSIYIASDGGLLHFDPDSRQHTRIVDATHLKDWDDIVTTCVCDSIIWFGNIGKELFALKRHGQQHILHDKAATPGQITDIVCDDSILWIGMSSGLARANIRAKVSGLTFVVPDIHVSQLLIADSTLWIATFGEGLFSIDFSNPGNYKQHISDLGGSTNFIYSIAHGGEGVLWLNTDGGTVSYNPITGAYLNLLEMGIGKRSPIIQLPDKSIVSGAYQVIRHFDPVTFAERGIAPKPYFTRINIANRQEAFDLAPDRISNVILKPNERELVVEFDALNHNSISTTEFQYRIDGLVDDWHQLGRRRYLNLNNLKPGDYVLEIRALNAYGGTSILSRQLSISVLRPVYQRRWFQLLALLAIASGVIFVIWRLRKRGDQQRFTRTVEYFANSRYAENSVDEILWDVARNVISRLNFVDCVVYLYDHASNELVQKAAYGEKNPRGRDIINPLRIPLGNGIVGYTAKHQKPVIISDTTQDTRYIVDIENKGSELAVPIVHQGEIIGVIDSEHSKKGFFKKEHAIVLSLIAKECAHKIADALAAEEIQQREHDLLNVKKEVAELKLTALQAQMNPHFIFNSLNSINWYILKNKPAEASTYLTKFSKLVRLILDNSESLSIPLQKELEALRLYLDLEAMRFADTFDYAIQADDEIDLEVVMIPPLILQPFVENAIWHGLMHKGGKGNLLIQIYPDNGHLKCIVQDNGIGRKASERLKTDGAPRHESKGLKLTTDRIRLIHKDYLKENTIHIIDLVDADGTPMGTRVEVLLPYD